MSFRRVAAVLVALGLVGVACKKVPYTGRKQFNAVPDGQMNQLGAQAYQELLAEVKVVQKGSDANVLRKVGDRIASVADQPDFDWQYRLINDAQINAWCLPGGYIGFYTGILPVLRSEAGMSFVMGHEVGHAVARHSAERMSQQLGLSAVLGALDVVLSGSGKVSEQQRGTIMGALGVGAEFGVLMPFGRSHEKEADIIGMMFMAEAGYPPAESMKVWTRMEELTGGGPPAFLSTHPSFAARKDNQQEWLPEARKRFQRNRRSGEDTLAQLWALPN